MQNLNSQLDKESLENIRLARQKAQQKLIIMTRRMKIHQIIYDNVKRDYTKVLRSYQKLDLAYALNTKVIICPAKTAKKSRIKRTRKNVMPAKIRKLLNTLPEDTKNRIIAAYN